MGDVGSMLQVMRKKWCMYGDDGQEGDGSGIDGEGRNILGARGH